MNISSIFLTEEGEKTLINYRTPHQHFFHEESDYEILKKARAIYLANLPGVSFTDRSKILHFAKKHNITTFVNIGVVDCRRPKDQLERFLKDVDILIINGYEFADLVKKKYKEINFKENVVMKHLPMFLDKILVITDGEKGSYAYHTAITYYQKAMRPPKIVDSTGAGDGYTAGFIAEYLSTHDIERAMAAGSKYAVKILGKIGAN